MRVTQPIDFSYQAGSILVLAQPTVVFHFFSPAVSILPEAFASRPFASYQVVEDSQALAPKARFFFTSLFGGLAAEIRSLLDIRAVSCWLIGRRG